MIRSIHLGNFKAFAETQEVPVRPLTLIYGPNSAGKSSIIHGLALAHHAILTGDLDTQRTEIGGESIDLGGFRQYVHRRYAGQPVTWALELDTATMTGRLAELLAPAQTVGLHLTMGIGYVGAQLSLFGGLPRSVDATRGVRVETFSVVADGVRVLAMSARREGVLHLDRIEQTHPIFRNVLRNLVLASTTTEEVHEEDFADLDRAVDELTPSIRARVTRFLPRIESAASSEAERAQALLLPVSRGSRHEQLAQAVQLVFPRVLRELIDGLGALVETAIGRLRYLGPLRSYPPRHLAPYPHHDPNWYTGGGYAWDVLRRDADVRAAVNRWLMSTERLSTPYEIAVRTLVPEPQLAPRLRPLVYKAIHDAVGQAVDSLNSDEASKLHDLAAAIQGQIEDLDSEDPDDLIPDLEEFLASFADADEISERWATELAADVADALLDLVLIDRRTDTVVSHRDVGIGISQVLPVLVSAYSLRKQLIAIEQPEIHLHPALQAELGDVFVESALGERSNTFLLETHSEHLLLRIMRRMRETADGDLPEGVSPVRPADVMVLFVEPDGPRSIVRQMPLNERGELVKAWPGGFFEEGLREVF